MPQGNRRAPFSGKQKKEQIQAKRDKKRAAEDAKERTASVLLGATASNNCDVDDETLGSGQELGQPVQEINKQPSRSNQDKNRYTLQFYEESKPELERRKREAQNKPLFLLPSETLEILIEESFPAELNFPTRPPWDFHISKEKLEMQEHKYFREYLDHIEHHYTRNRDLSLFELNLETWRQLWRVLEMSDIVLVIVDIRFPTVLFPPSLYSYVKSIDKEIVLVLNKIDLIPAPLVVAWKNYFQTTFPDLNIVFFTSFPGYNLKGATVNKRGMQVRRQRGKLRMASEGALQVLDVCEKIVQGQVNLTSWHSKIEDEMSSLSTEQISCVAEHTEQLMSQDTSFYLHEKFKNGILTLGCVGQPNVGKSSLINALMGKKVVSVSRTPGHTKHFQTIFVTKTVRLCDCPGLVFPSCVCRPLQVLSGSYPIAQLREPFSSIAYIAQNIDLVKLLALNSDEDDDEETVWTAFRICDSWALKRGFLTAKTARPDTFRASNHMLRMALEGKLGFCLRPSGYTKDEEKWKSHPGLAEVLAIVHAEDEEKAEEVLFSEDSESTDSEDNGSEFVVTGNKFDALNLHS